MRILLFTDRFPPEVRASAQLFHELAVELVSRGHQVGVVTRMPADYIPSVTGGSAPSKRALLDGIDVIRVGSLSAVRRAPIVRALDQFLLGAAFMLASRQLPVADAVLVYSPPLPLALTARLYSWWRGSPFVLNLHDFYPQTAIELGLLKNRLGIALARWMEKIVYRNAARIVVPAPSSRRILLEREGLAPDTVCLIPNWADVDHVRPGPRENGFRAGHGLSGSFVVSFAGVMGFAQDLTSVIEAARALRDQPDIVFLLVGEGIYRDRWQETARGLGNVRFLPMQAKNDYFDLLRASDVCLVPLTRTLESPAIPGKIQSIMAVARPVVAIVNGDGDAAELIRKTQCGLVVAPERASELVDTIRRLHGDRGLGEWLGANGRAYAEQHFSLRYAADAYEAVLRTALRNRGIARGLREPILKRPFDCVLAGFGLVLLLPLWLLFAAWICLEDGTPIFFRQQRIGRYGRLFSVLKFRSMIKNPGTVEVQAGRNDPRITRVGRVLRRTAMDELPQLWNIFIGDMSFVGPRALLEKERVKVKGVEEDVYIRDVTGYELRQLVRPGLTGITQVCARRDIAHKYKFKHDLIYVRQVIDNARRPSLVGDLRMFVYDLRLILLSVWITVRARWEV
jgi:lipopolysaccharide/colanic/teichoic acid biosynthesis glycosyltransferase/glycosyltransferase involved in cell wall biosynthesis